MAQVCPGTWPTSTSNFASVAGKPACRQLKRPSGPEHVTLLKSSWCGKGWVPSLEPRPAPRTELPCETQQRRFRLPAPSPWPRAKAKEAQDSLRVNESTDPRSGH